MEFAQIKLAAERQAGSGAEFFDPQFAYLIRQRLAGPGNVAIDLVGDVERVLGRVRHEKVDGPLPVPTHRVHARIDHQAHRPPHLVSELPEFRIRVVVKSHVLA